VQSRTWRRPGAEVSFLRRERTSEIPDEVGWDVVADGCVGEVGVQEAPRPGLDEPFGSLVRWTGWRSRSRPWGCGQVGERLLGQTCERSGRQARNTFCARCAGRRLSPWPADSASRRLPRRAPEVDGPIRGCRRGQVLGPSGSRARCAGRRPMFNVGGPIRRGLPGGCVRRPAARPLRGAAATTQ